MSIPVHVFPDFFNLLRQRLPDRFVRVPRKLSPAQLLGVLCLMTGFGRKGYRRVIAELSTGLGRAFGWPAVGLIPSPQAIGQARRSLSPAVCDLAFAAVAEHCPMLSERPVARYGAYRLLAIDGTRLSLPQSPALMAAFGAPSNQRGTARVPMAGLVQIWDVGRNAPVAFSLSTCDFDERSEAMTLFDRLGPSDLLIGDRGYPGYAFFRALCRRRARFLIRMPINAGSAVATAVPSVGDDCVIFLKQRDGHGRQVAGTPSIPVRLIRVALPNGKDEILATNLWHKRGHDAQALAQLYIQRWRIETAFREMKVGHALEQFSATYPDGIYQEIVAIQIFLLLTSELEAVARRDADTRPPVTPKQPKKSAAAEPASIADATDSTAPADATTTQAIASEMPAAGDASASAIPLHLGTLRFNRLLVADNVIHLLRHAAEGGRRAVARAMPDILTYLWKNRSYVRPGRLFPRRRKCSLGRHKKD